MNSVEATSHIYDVVTCTDTGNQYYNEILTNQNQDDIVGEIHLLSPSQYYEVVSENALIRGIDYSKTAILISRRSHYNTLNQIKNVITTQKEKVCLPVLDFYHKKQDGLHRMMVIGDLFGWDVEVPVLCVISKDDLETLRNI